MVVAVSQPDTRERERRDCLKATATATEGGLEIGVTVDNYHEDGSSKGATTAHGKFSGGYLEAGDTRVSCFGFRGLRRGYKGSCR